MLRALLLLSFLILPAFSLICPPEFILINEQKCVKIMWTPASHWDAAQNCKWAPGGTLVTIKNAIDNRAILNLLSSTSGIDQIWLGMNCFGNDTSTCFWDNGSGSPIPYDNFESLSRFSLSGRCITMMVASYFSSQGKWRNVPCYNDVLPGMTFLPYICEVPPSVPDYFCVNNYNGFCYTTSRSFVANLSLATSYCKSGMNAANLTSIHSKMEIDYIRYLYRGTNTTHILLGAQKDPNSGRFYWIDGSKWDFEYMKQLSFQQGDCLVMDVQGYGLWSQVDCDQKFEFLCKQNIYVPPTPAPITVSDTNLLSEKLEEANQILEYSNCNSTLILAPGSISSFGYPDFTAPASYCTWQIFALAPYRLGIYVDFWATYGSLNIFDEYGKNIGEFVGTYDRKPFLEYTLFNVATITFQPMPKTGSAAERGLHAVILPS